MVADMVADMKVEMVPDMDVDKVAPKVADMVANKKTKIGRHGCGQDNVCLQFCLKGDFMSFPVKKFHHQKFSC